MLSWPSHSSASVHGGTMCTAAMHLQQSIEPRGLERPPWSCGEENKNLLVTVEIL